ncbi:LacI family DNA-binding transcriptional regulator [Paenirhodobacter sp. CAU 1674]|uniref:LacI family DNA-binding transcriptional regulator n=1 Tax=Paenirhodobacter sp. CAU 1674 TaxID=3032596 RepID=UPI0023D9A798|nr:LacI family DNA-binding transcriptional regulator [Paenirhodobacter sp. CAU 1674]MDF2143244.1 LacI family DNA-binding transcriptional regulator [Paenirhodobacter sp. CAU 1674]
MTVSIKDVARAAGVSTSTVSRALGQGPVSADVLRRVESAVAATGYRPNLAARQLRSQRSRTIGLIIADIRNPFFTQVSRAVEDVAYAAGMRVLLCNTDEDPEREAMYLELMAEERVSGLIVTPTLHLTAAALQRVDRPVVLIDRTVKGGDFDSIVLDNTRAAAQLVDHLVACGRRRIVGLFGSTSSTGGERRAEVEAALTRHGLPVRSIMSPPSFDAGHAALAEMLDREHPDALILSNGLFVRAALKLCHERRIPIPERLALAGFDDEVWSDLVNPGMTVIRQPVEAFGREAMTALLGRIGEARTPPRRITLSGELIVRGSTAPA